MHNNTYENIKSGLTNYKQKKLINAFSKKSDLSLPLNIMKNWNISNWIRKQMSIFMGIMFFSVIWVLWKEDEYFLWKVIVFSLTGSYWLYTQQESSGAK